MPTATKKITVLPQIIPPATLASNATLLTDISALSALNPKELMALAIVLRTAELAVDPLAGITVYNLYTGTNAQIITAATKLVQDMQAVLGNVPDGDLPKAGVAIDYSNASNTGVVLLPTDVDNLRNLFGMSQMVDRPVDELKRILIYLRMELGI